MGDGERDGRATLKEAFSVARSPKLSANEVRLWMLIRSYEHPDGRGAYPGEELLAAHMDKSPRSVQEYRRQLRKKGYLKRQLRGPKPAHWWAVVPKDAQQTASQEAESIEADCDLSPDRSEADCETNKGSQKGSQEESQPASPEYGEYGEYDTQTGPGGDEAGAADSYPSEDVASTSSWPTPSDLPSPTEATERGYPEDFEAAWEAYPKREGGNPKKGAYRKWLARVRNGASPEELLAGVQRYAAFCEAEGRTGTRYVKQAGTFFGPDEHFREDWGTDDGGSGPDYLERRL